MWLRCALEHDLRAQTEQKITKNVNFVTFGRNTLPCVILTFVVRLQKKFGLHEKLQNILAKDLFKNKILDSLVTTTFCTYPRASATS